MSASVSERFVSPPRASSTGLRAWMDERFPLAHLPLFAVLYLLALLHGRATGSAGSPLALGLADLAGFVAVYAFFLALRVADEHKDFASDCLAHPERVLQRGGVTLRQLRWLGLAAIAVQLSASLLIDGGFGPVSARWLLVAGWSALMAREFFAPSWLRRRLVVYAATHMAVMPLAVLWMAQMGAGRASLPASAGWLAMVAYCSGFAFEIARKTHAPEDERPLVDSYSKRLGVRGVVLALALLLAASGAALVFLVLGAAGSGAPPALYVALLALPAPAAPALGAFARRPTRAAARRVRHVVSLSMIAAYLLPVVALVMARGLAWR
jgi:4-hydroxybenzoate polyprenyltransferase